MSAEVLVTGGTGFLGRQILGALHRAGVPAAALVREPKGGPIAQWSAEVGAVSLVPGEVNQPTAWQAHPALAKVRTIIHSAAIVIHGRPADPQLAEVNVAGTLNVVRAAAALGARVIFVSTSGTVGCYRHADLRADEHAPFAEATVGRWPYYASKIQAERESRRLAEKLGVPFTVARPPVLLGPDDHRGRSTEHVARVLDGRIPFVPEGGMHFTDVRDLAAALVVLAHRETWRPTYHFPGHESPLGAFFQQVAEVGGLHLDRPTAPGWLLKGLARGTDKLARLPRYQRPRWLPDPVVLEMAAHHWGLSSLWTEAELGYRARPARQTLADTIHWLRQQPAGARKRAH